MILDSTSLPLDKILHSGFVKIQQGIAFKQLENYWYYVTARYFFYFEQEKKNPLGKEISRYPSKKKKKIEIKNLIFFFSLNLGFYDFNFVNDCYRNLLMEYGLGVSFWPPLERDVSMSLENADDFEKLSNHIVVNVINLNINRIKNITPSNQISNYRIISNVFANMTASRENREVKILIK